ncbi:spermidine N1-acetyltransferase [Pseudonocardia phyllosphaerae]|uniref:spermidine N1-acetyltransferase n=1 Tax=Pseudonocardia phyllosphaerae TaxID=3390502 RepID=UPI00397BB96A
MTAPDGEEPLPRMRLRALERDDLPFVHGLSNDSGIMSYWFEEPYEALVELQDLYDRHVHDNRERRFVIQLGDPGAEPDPDRDWVPRDGRGGLVELVEIDYIHRNAEFQIVVAPSCQGRGLAARATAAALDYAFGVLNLHKVYLVVDVENHRAVRAYERVGFTVEGELREEYFANGRYRDAYRMAVLQRDHLGPTTPR